MRGTCTRLSAEPIDLGRRTIGNRENLDDWKNEPNRARARARATEQTRKSQTIARAAPLPTDSCRVKVAARCDEPEEKPAYAISLHDRLSRTFLLDYYWRSYFAASWIAIQSYITVINITLYNSALAPSDFVYFNTSIFLYLIKLAKIYIRSTLCRVYNFCQVAQIKKFRHL